MSYSWRKCVEKLTDDMKERGVIYASQLVVTNNAGIDHPIHEVFKDDPEADEKIKLLEDVTFFKNLAHSAGYKVRENIWR